MLCCAELSTPAVLLDLLHAIPTAALVRLRPGERHCQGSHELLLQVGCSPPTPHSSMFASSLQADAM